MSMEQVIALAGPTGAGKTGTLLALAARLGGRLQVISADSVQAIRAFDIGSAKPTIAEQAILPHHCIDVVNPDQRYDAWRFSRDADAVIEQLEPGLIPVATAGTGLYLAAWQDGLNHVPELPEPERAGIAAEVESDPIAAHRQLSKLDPEFAGRIHPNDVRRISRGFELHRATGLPPGRALDQHRGPKGPQLTTFGIWAEGADYEAFLEQRIRRMLANDWIGEVRELRESWGPDLPGLETVGYRQINEHLDGNLPGDELAPAILLATRRYAKRQRTWFRRRTVRWFPFSNGDPPPGLVDALLAEVEMAYN